MWNFLKYAYRRETRLEILTRIYEIETENGWFTEVIQADILKELGHKVEWENQ